MLLRNEQNLLIDRDLAWLEFNRRVLKEAKDPTVPLLERVKFLAIFSSNLDEFFMVRVAGLKRWLYNKQQSPDPEDADVASALSAISQRAHELTEEQHLCFLNTVLPQLTAEGIHLVRPEEMTSAQEQCLEDFFHKTLYPIVTPLAIDPGHPFPYLTNRSLSLIVSLRSKAASPLPYTELSIVNIPAQVVPRFVQLPAQEGQYAFMLLEHVLRHYLPRLYHGFEILSAHAIRVTRDAEFGLVRRRDEDLLMTIEQGIRERRMGDAVRLQYDPDLPKELLNQLVEELELSGEDLYPGKGLTAFTDLFQLYGALPIPRLKDRVQIPLKVPSFERGPDIWNTIRNGDLMVFHPYQSFDAVTHFVDEAAKDPKVLAIKMTLYRVSPNSPIAQALARAAEAGKEVSVLVELQARFDEEANITWARALEEVGAHVVYGLVGYKTHCKVCLVVRQETDGIRRYCHLSTGNYNVRTSSIYSDIGIFTCRESFGEDLTELFNFLTGLYPAAKIESLGAGADRTARTLYSFDPTRNRAGPCRDFRADHRESEQSHRWRRHRRTLRRQPGRCKDRPYRARHVQPSTRHRRSLRKHSRRLDHRSLSRACPRLLFSQWWKPNFLVGVGGLDAAQFRSPHRNRFSGRGASTAKKIKRNP